MSDGVPAELSMVKAVRLPCANRGLGPEDEWGIFLEPNAVGRPVIRAGKFNRINRTYVGALSFDLNALTKVGAVLEHSTAIRDFVMRIRNTKYSTSPDVVLSGTFKMVESLDSTILYQDLVEVRWDCKLEYNPEDTEFGEIPPGERFDFIRRQLKSCSDRKCSNWELVGDYMSECVDGVFEIKLSSARYWNHYRSSLYHQWRCADSNEREKMLGSERRRCEDIADGVSSSLDLARRIQKALPRAASEVRAAYLKRWRRCSPSRSLERAWSQIGKPNIGSPMWINVFTPSANPLYPPPRYFNVWRIHPSRVQRSDSLETQQETIKNAFQIWYLIALEKYRAGRQ